MSGAASIPSGSVPAPEPPPATSPSRWHVGKAALLTYSVALGVMASMQVMTHIAHIRLMATNAELMAANVQLRAVLTRQLLQPCRPGLSLSPGEGCSMQFELQDAPRRHDHHPDRDDVPL